MSATETSDPPGEPIALGPDAAAAVLPEAAPASPGVARQAAGGGLAILGAKGSFILFGFAQQLALQWLLGTDGYGDISRVLAIVGIVNNVVVATSIQGVSRAVSSAGPERADAAYAATLRIHAVLALCVATIFALVAGLIARLVGAPHIALPLRMVGGVVLMYGVYAPMIGSLNGRRRFGAQASLDVSYTLIRTVGLVGGATFFMMHAGTGVLGAASGFVASAVLIVPIAIWIAGLGKRGVGGPTARTYLAFLAPLAVGQVFLNLLMQTDLLVLSHYAGNLAEQSGVGIKAANEFVGVYRSVQLFAFLPYQLLMSISFVLFPMLARADAENDRAAVAQFTMTGVRLALITTGLMCGTVAGLAPFVLRLLPLKDVADTGGTPLRILALGMGSFAIFGISTSALTSLGRERVAAGLTATAVVLVAVACVIVIPSGELGPAMLVRTASGAAAALTIAALAGGFALRRVAGAFAPMATLVRVLGAVAVTVAVGSRMPWHGKKGVVAEACVMAALYVVILVVTRELKGADLDVVRGALGRKRGAR